MSRFGEIREGITIAEKVIEKVAPTLTEHLTSEVQVAGRMLDDVRQRLPKPLSEMLAHVNEGSMPAKPLWDVIDHKTFQAHIKEPFLQELSDVEATSHTLEPVHQYANSRRALLNSAPSAVVSDAEKQALNDDTLKFIYNGEAEKRGSIYSIPEARLSDKYGFTTYGLDEIQRNSRAASDYISNSNKFDDAPRVPEVKEYLTNKFGVFDDTARRTAHELLDSSHPESPWSPRNLVAQAGLEATHANIGAAGNLHLFQMTPANRALGIELLAKHAEQETAYLAHLSEVEGRKPLPHQIAGTIYEKTRHATADDIRAALQKGIEEKKPLIGVPYGGSEGMN